MEEVVVPVEVGSLRSVRQDQLQAQGSLDMLPSSTTASGTSSGTVKKSLRDSDSQPPDGDIDSNSYVDIELISRLVNEHVARPLRFRIYQANIGD